MLYIVALIKLETLFPATLIYWKEFDKADYYRQYYYIWMHLY